MFLGSSLATGGPSGRKNYREFWILPRVLAYYERFTDLLLLFVCNLGSIHGHFNGIAAHCLFGIVFLHKAKQGRPKLTQVKYISIFTRMFLRFTVKPSQAYPPPPLQDYINEMSSMKLNPFKDFQSDQIQRSSRKIFTAHYACRNAHLNLTLVTGTTNGFIIQIINSLIESWGWGVRLTCLDCNNCIEFLIQSLKIVRNMQNSIETCGNLCIELGWPVVWLFWA